MLLPLKEFRAKLSHFVIGLMSGTSADGVDAALCELSGQGRGKLKVRLVAGYTEEYPPELGTRVLALCEPGRGTAAEICELNFLIAEVFARSANGAMRKAGLAADRIDAIGSHGQTVWHIPPHADAHGSTLQLGEPAVIAERTGVLVVSNFRARDMAAGGQGAPLVPYVDYLLFSDDHKTRVALNIGGIANLTYLPAGGKAEDTLAFDTGPGNMIIDALVQFASESRQTFDRDGAKAASGRVDRQLLDELLAHDFLQRPPPKSTGREQFGAQFARELRQKHPDLPSEDLIATATAFTTASIAGSVRRFLAPRGRVDELIVAGGGALNPVIMQRLRDELPETKIDVSDEYGVPLKAKEAIAFAILARETLLGRPGNLPSATGASGPRVLGQITP